jgi:hypothetical protein
MITRRRIFGSVIKEIVGLLVKRSIVFLSFREVA